MKSNNNIPNSYLCIVFFVLTFVKANAQRDYFKALDSPNVSGFSNVNYFPVDESIGKVNITIPIYAIDLDGLNIPISISYNTGGVKVNSSASTVGLNWSLNAGGLIKKEIKGFDDTKLSFAVLHTRLF